MTDPHEPPGLSPSRKVAWNAAVRAGAEVIAKLASVAFFVVMARELAEGGFGDFMFALSFTTVLLLASGFGTEELIAREVARRPDSVHEYLSDVVALKLVLSLLLLLLGVAIVIVGGYPQDVQVAVLLVGAGVAIENLGRTWGAVFQAYQRMALTSVALIVQRVVTAAVGVAALLSGAGLVPVSVIFAAGSVIGLVINVALLGRYVVKVRIGVDRSRWWPLIKQGFPIGLVGVLGSVLLRLDQTLVSFLADNKEVGYYAAAFRLVEATMFIGWSAAAAILPWFAAQPRNSTKLAGGFELGVKATTAVLLPIGLGFALFAEPIVELLYGSEYAAAVVPLRWLGAMIALLGMNDLISVVLIARDRPLLFARVIVAVVVVNVGLNIVLIPDHGASGAAFTAALSALMLAVLGAFCTVQVTGRLRLLRSLAGPLLGGAVMTGAVALGAGLPDPVALVLGVLVYGATFAGFERFVFPDDFHAFLALAKRGRAPGPPPTAVEL